MISNLLSVGYLALAVVLLFPSFLAVGRYMGGDLREDGGVPLAAIAAFALSFLWPLLLVLAAAFWLSRAVWHVTLGRPVDPDESDRTHAYRP